MMHDCLDDDRRFQHEHSANQVVVTFRHAQPCPQMGAVAVLRRSLVDDLKQQLNGKAPFRHTLSSMIRHDDGPLETLAVHHTIMRSTPATEG